MRALFEVGGFREGLLTSDGCGGTVTPPTCNIPDGLTTSSITENSSTVSWTTTSASSYDVQYRPVGNTVWLNTSSTSTSASLSALTTSTQYEFQVRSACSATDVSAYSASTTFTTLSPSTGPTYCSCEATDATIEWIQNVSINTINNTSGSNGGYGNFTALSTDLQIGSSVSISVTPGFSSTEERETWLAWIDFNQDGAFDERSELVFDGESRSSSAISGSFTIPSTATLGVTRLRIAMLFNDDPLPCGIFSFGEVEDYTVNLVSTASPPATCDVPSGLSASNISDTSATLNWTSTGASNYEIRHRESGLATWTNTNSNTISTDIDKLNPSTTYEYQVKSVCSATSSSDFSTIATFTTITSVVNPPSTCDTPTSLSTSNITDNSATLNWVTTNASSYDARYRPSGATTWINTSSTTISININTLSSSTTYEFQVRSVCSTTSTSNFSASSSFTTLSTNPLPTTCNAPGGLFASPIMDNGATLNWSSITGAVSYDVEYREEKGANWTVASSTTNSITITGLTSKTKYEWQVKSVCSSTSTSNFSAMEQFETLKQGEAPQAKTGNNSGYINLITDQLTVNMYPSPVKEVSNVTLSINNKTIKNLNLKLFNLQGALLFEDDINTSEDSFDYKLPVIQLDGGIYYLMIGNRNAIVTKKLIVLD